MERGRDDIEEVLNDMFVETIGAKESAMFVGIDFSVQQSHVSFQSDLIVWFAFRFQFRFQIQFRSASITFNTTATVATAAMAAHRALMRRYFYFVVISMHDIVCIVDLYKTHKIPFRGRNFGAQCLSHNR